METIAWHDFEKVELRAGTVIEVEDFPNWLLCPRNSITRKMVDIQQHKFLL